MLPPTTLTQMVLLLNCIGPVSHYRDSYISVKRPSKTLHFVWMWESKQPSVQGVQNTFIQTLEKNTFPDRQISSNGSRARMRCPVRTSSGIRTIVIKLLCRFPQSFQRNAGIVQAAFAACIQFSICCRPAIWLKIPVVWVKWLSNNLTL